MNVPLYWQRVCKVWRALWPFDPEIALFSKPCCSNFDRYPILEHNILHFPTGRLWVLKIIQYIYRMVLSFEHVFRLVQMFLEILLLCYWTEHGIFGKIRHTHTKFIPCMPRGLAASHVKRWLPKAKGLFCSSVIKWSVKSQMLGRRSCVGWHQLGENWRSEIWTQSFSFFPTCQVRVVRFYVSCLLLSASPLLLLLLNRDPRRTVFSVGPQPRPSTPSVPCRTSTTTIPAQCSLPDLNHDHPRPVFPAGPQPRVSTPSVPCRTSCRKIWDKERAEES